MKPIADLFPEPNLIAGVVILAGLAVLAVFTVIHLIQRFILFPRLKEQLFRLNGRRAERIRQAFAAAANTEWSPPEMPTPYPFAGWVELADDGSIKIAGQTFHAGAAFQAIARDDNHIPRASITTEGNGDVFILSHGQRYKARYHDHQWNIEFLPHES